MSEQTQSPPKTLHKHPWQQPLFITPRTYTGFFLGVVAINRIFFEMMNEEFIKVTPKSSLETILHLLNTDS